MANSLEASPDGKPRVFLWINPRSLSTVFEKFAAHMDGADIWHEPYTTEFFNRLYANPETFTKFPRMQGFVDQHQETLNPSDFEKPLYAGGNLVKSDKYTIEYITENLSKPLEDGKEFLFVKDAAFGIDGHYDDLPKIPFKHTFLIRHPNRSVISEQKLIAYLFEHKGNPEDLDIGPGTHPFLTWDMIPSRNPVYELWKYVKEHLDPNPVVIDADDLQNHPGDILEKYCEAVGIPWKDRYITWDAGEGYLKQLHGSIDQIVWGRETGMYIKAFQSSGMEPCKDQPPKEIPTTCETWAEEFREGYKVMYEHRL